MEISSCKESDKTQRPRTLRVPGLPRRATMTTAAFGPAQEYCTHDIVFFWQPPPLAFRDGRLPVLRLKASLIPALEKSRKVKNTVHLQHNNKKQKTTKIVTRYIPTPAPAKARSQVVLFQGFRRRHGCGFPRSRHLSGRRRADRAESE